MKEMSVKKIVLCSIAALSALMLLIGLAFSVLSLTVGGVSANSAGMGVNGFNMLSFGFPEVLQAFLLSAFVATGYDVEEITLSRYEIPLGIISLITLLAAIAFLVVIILALFRFSYKKTKRLLLFYFVFGASLLLIGMVIAMVCCISLNNVFKEAKMENLYKCKTSSYFPLIFLAVFFAGYIVCEKLIKEEGSAESVAGTDGVAERGPKKISVVEQLQQEKAIIGVIRGYKALLDEEIISAADYVYIKAKLLSPVQKRSGHCEEKEMLIINILREYQRLYTEQIITSAEFIEKKGELIQL